MFVIASLSSILFFFLKKPIIQHHNVHNVNVKASQITSKSHKMEIHNKSIHTFTSFAGPRVTLKGVVISLAKFSINKRFLYMAP